MAKDLTILAIEKAAPAAKRYELPDGKVVGLFLIVQPSGAKSWAVRYRIAGEPKKYTIGSFPEIDLSTARKLAQRALGQVAQGIDPGAQKQAARAAAKAEKGDGSDRVEAVVAEFIERYAKKNTRAASWREVERILNREIVEGARPNLAGDLVRGWKGRRLGDVQKRDVIALLDRIVDDSAPVVANRTLAAFRRLCNWAVERGIIAASPCEKIKAPAGETSRDRVLDDDEIRAAWAAFERVGWPFGKIAQLLLLTAARRDEVGSMTWGEIDLAAGTWAIAKERCKGGVAHEIPLSPTATELLASLPRVGKIVFSTNGKTAVSGFSRAKDQVDRVILEMMGEAPARWTYHDLRRTAASKMAGLGVPPHVIEATIGHKSGVIKGIAQVYNRYAYAAEKRAALAAWGRALQAIVSGETVPDNVVQYSARA